MTNQLLNILINEGDPHTYKKTDWMGNKYILYTLETSKIIYCCVCSDQSTGVTENIQNISTKHALNNLVCVLDNVFQKYHPDK